MTDKEMPLTTESTTNDSQEAVTQSTKTTKSTAQKASTKKAVANSGQKKGSALALFAIIIALGATTGHYFWQQQQNQLLTIKLSEQIEHKNTATFNQYEAQIKQALIEQQQTFTKQLQQVASQVQNSNQAKITELNTTVSQLERSIKQRQPSDWLEHEAEYLIRIAARTLWLEHDTTAAIGLLKDADARLAELNDPAFLPVREVIHQDIKSLELMPTLQTDEVVLALMAMNKQVAMLPLAMVDLGKKTDNKVDLVLSDDINDWQTNLAKTWQKFLDDFIRVRQRTGLIEPLISPEQQQHLKQNLHLKIQLALWAASERKGDIYQQTLTDIQRWLKEFFDLTDETNQHFLQALSNLQTQQVSYDYPSELTSLTAMRVALKKQPSSPLSSPKKAADDTENKSQGKPLEEVNKEPKKATPLPDMQNKSQGKPLEEVNKEPKKATPLPDLQNKPQGKLSENEGSI